MFEDPSPPENLLHEGLVVDKYRLLARLGAGAMGAVYRAEHVTLGHPVALKFLHAGVGQNPDSRARFEREARIAAQLGDASRHVARVLDHGVFEGRTPYLVMELLRGEGLDARLGRDRRLAPSLVVEIVRQLCRALTVAHEAGVVHRDVKPANVFLCTDEDDRLLVKLLDFGVAKARVAGVAFATSEHGALLGTPAYMSPEQLDSSSELDARADLWAVTALVYRALTGFPPFTAGSLAELVLRVVTSDPPRPTQEEPSLPVGIDAFVARGLSKRIEDRFQTAGELVSALERVLEPKTEPSLPVAASRADATPEAPARGESPAPMRSEPPEATRAEPRMRKRFLALRIVAVLVVIVVVAIAAFSFGLSRVASGPPRSYSAKMDEGPKPRLDHEPVAPQRAPSDVDAEASGSASAKPAHVVPRATVKPASAPKPAPPSSSAAAVPVASLPGSSAPKPIGAWPSKPPFVPPSILPSSILPSMRPKIAPP